MAIIIYSVGYCKLTGAVGYKNKTVNKLGLLTRNVAICLTFSVLSSLACEYAAVGVPVISVQPRLLHYTTNRRSCAVDINAITRV